MRSQNDQRGAATVEMAFLAPVLILLLLGIAEFGRLAFTQINLTDAAQEGALYASFNPGDPLGARTRVVDAFDDPSISLNDVSVVCLSSTSIEVRVGTTMPLITAFFGGPTMNLDAEASSDVLALSACVASP